MIAQVAPQPFALTKQFDVSRFLLAQGNTRDVYRAETLLREAWQEGRGKRSGVCFYWKVCFLKHVK